MTKKLRPPSETTVVIAMSGGLDSSVAAALMVERGYNCIGVMMRLWAEVGTDDGSASTDSINEGSTNKCCSVESVADAREVADMLGIPFYLINVEEPFKRNVVEFFIDSYSSGLTPNPCLECNRHIRFDYLLNYARNLGADYLVTGHHARTRRLEDGGVELLKAVDDQKDQSYVLSVMGQDELQDVLFPVGDYLKPQLRAMAAERKLPIAAKSDSMDLCFVADDDYRRFLRDWAIDAMQPGPILNRQGEQLGEHLGLPNYTIGQRKGLGINGSAVPLFVLELDSNRNALIVGEKSELGQTHLLAQNINWTSGIPPASGARVHCKIRYKAVPMDCTIYPQSDGSVQVEFEEPLFGITPGQGAIFYDNDICLGGGIIVKEQIKEVQIKEIQKRDESNNYG